MRTFLALNLQEATLDALEAARARIDDRSLRIRWVTRENRHLTMFFLGEVPDAGIREVCDLSAAAAAQVEPFEYGIRGLRCVPPSGPLRMVWAGVEDPDGGLARLHERLAQAVGGLGGHQETRAFAPHITLGRVKAPSPAADLRSRARAYAETDFGAQRAEELIVYASQLTPRGPVYDPLARCPLGGR